MKMVGIRTKLMKILSNLKCGVSSVLLRRFVPVLCALMVLLSSLAFSAPEASAAGLTFSSLPITPMASSSGTGVDYYVNLDDYVSPLFINPADKPLNTVILRQQQYGSGFYVNNSDRYGVAYTVTFDSSQIDYFHYNTEFQIPWEFVRGPEYVGDYVRPKECSISLTTYDLNGNTLKGVSGLTATYDSITDFYILKNLQITGYLRGCAYFKFSFVLWYDFVAYRDYYLGLHDIYLVFKNVVATSPLKQAYIYDESGSAILRIITHTDSVFNNAANVVINVRSDGFVSDGQAWTCPADREFLGLEDFSGGSSKTYGPGSTIIVDSAATKHLRILTGAKAADPVEKNFWDSAIDFFKAIPNWFESVIDGIVSLPGKIQLFFNNLGSSIGGFFSDLTSDMAGWFSSVITGITNLPGKIQVFFNNLGSSIGGFFTNLGSDMAGWFTNLGNTIGGYFSKVVEDLKGLLALPVSFGNDVLQFLTNGFNSVIDFFKSLFNMFTVPETVDGEKNDLFTFLFGTGKDTAWAWVSDIPFFEDLGVFFARVGDIYNALPVEVRNLITFAFVLPLCFSAIKMIVG